MAGELTSAHAVGTNSLTAVLNRCPYPIRLAGLVS